MLDRGGLRPTSDGQALSHDDTRALRLTFAFVLACVTISSLHAAIHARGLYQDGSYYLYRVAERDGLYLVDPGRTTVQVLRQAPIALMSRYGDFSLLARGQVFTFAMLAWPALLCAACWLVLPRERKAWILLPLLDLLVGVSATSFNAVGEAAIASGYVWPMLFLLLFRTRDPASQALFLLLCIPAFHLHEGAFLLTLTLLIACALRAAFARAWGERIFLAASAALLVWILVYQLGWVISPRIPGGRELALRALYRLELLLADGRLNLPVVTGAAALAALAGVLYVHSTQPAEIAASRSRVVALAFVPLALGAALAAWLIDASFAPYSQIQARYHPVYVSAALGTAAALTLRAGLPERRMMQPAALVIVAALAVAQTAAEMAATWRWSNYIADYRARLAGERGLIAWQTTLATGDERRDAEWRLMSATWVVPILSIALAERGVVTAMIGYPADLTFRPVDPEKPDALPGIRAIDYAPFKSSLAAQKRAGTP